MLETESVDGSSGRNDVQIPATQPGNGNLSDRGIGYDFEDKLATLFIVRSINQGYQFELTMDQPKIGGKFDDLIIRYKFPDCDKEQDKWRYRYMQIKHKTDPTKREITKETLLSKKDDYGLVKYFDSFCQIQETGANIQDCIICTNINFKHSDVDGIELKLHHIDNENEDVLKFETNSSRNVKHQRNLFKLELSGEFRTKLISLLNKEIELLAEKLKDCSKGIKAPSLKDEIFKKYHVALIEENVVEILNKRMKLHKNFIDNLETLSTGAKSLRCLFCDLSCEELSNWKFQLLENFGVRNPNDEQPRKLPSFIKDKKDLDDFFQKLLFVVNTPSITELDKIISDEFLNYYDRDDNKNQYRLFCKKMKEWSNSQNKSEWLTSRDGKKILLEGVSKQSTDYRNQLLKELEFNQNAIKNMADTLGSSTDKVLKFSSLSPRWTAIKIISAIETWPEYKTSGEESYWVTSAKSILKEETKQLWKNRLKLTKNSHHFLLIVDDEKSFESSNHKDLDSLIENGNRIILISHDLGTGTQDEIHFTDLNDVSQKTLLSKKILFQGKEMDVENLILNTASVDEQLTSYQKVANKIIDCSSIKELMNCNEKPIKVPSFSSSHFEQSLYISRKMTSPFSDQSQDGEQVNQMKRSITDEINGKCKIKSDGKIEWLVQEDEEKLKAWEKIKSILERNVNSPDHESTNYKVSDEEVIKLNNKNVIIMGVAGTGKSTILSHYYEQIKKEKSDYWVIKLNLVDHPNTLSKFNTSQLNQTGAIEFLLRFSAVVDNQSPFSRLLLKHRLETGDRIILMLDGFDEIDSHCQNNVIQLIKCLNTSIPFYVTTRPHMADKLQFALSQLAYNLVKFNREDQIKYLTSIWARGLTIDNNIQDFAGLLVDRVSEALNDQEREFIGIPLQCRILAECFHSKIQCFAQNNENQNFSVLLEDQHFDLASLYKLLMQTKHQVFHQNKIKLNNNSVNHIVYNSIEMAINQMNNYMRNLAIETIFHQKEHVDLLRSNESSRYQSDEEKEKEIKVLEENCICFGLLDRNQERKVQFLHRTYAEYLVADYIYKGFPLNEGIHNRLLENEDVCQLIASTILAKDEYNGVGVFLDSMFKDISNFSASSGIENQPNNFVKDIIMPKCLEKFIIRTDLYYSEVYYLNRRPLLCTLIVKLYNNIIKFVFNCLDITFVPSHIRKRITFLFLRPNYWILYSYKNIFQLKPENFRRLLAYYDRAPDEEWHIMFNDMCCKYFLQKLRLDRDESKENLKYFLAYMNQHRKRLKNFAIDYSSEENAVREVAFCIIKNPHFNDLLPDLIEFFSTITENVPRLLTDLFENAYDHLHQPFHLESGRITETVTLLDNLITIGDTEMSDLSRLILSYEPEKFRNLCQQQRHAQDDGITDMKIYSLTVLDRLKITSLRRAALLNDTQTVDQILNSYSSSSFHESRQKINDVFVNEKYDFTPLYLALVCCHEEMCLAMLKFLKQVLTNDNLCTFFSEENGCFYRALTYAIRLEKKETIQMILKCVKTALGMDFLIKMMSLKIVLGSDSHEIMEYDRHDNRPVFSTLIRKGWSTITISVLVQDDEINGYKHISDLIFNDTKEYFKVFRYLEDVLQRIISANKLDELVTRLLESDFHTWFQAFFLSKHFLNALDKNQRSELVDIFTSQTNKSPQNGQSYWTKIFDDSSRSEWIATTFVKIGPSLLRETDLRKLFFHDNFVFLRKKILLIEKKKVDEMFISYSKEFQLDLHHHLKEEGPKLIEEVFFNKDMGNHRTEAFHKNWFAHLLLYLDYGTNDQLSKFAETITKQYGVFIVPGTAKQLSIWDYIIGKWNMLVVRENSDRWIHHFPIYSNDEDLQFLIRRISEKLGENAARDLILHNNGNGIFTLRPYLIQWKYDELYTHLSKEKRDEIRQGILATPEVINQMIPPRKPIRNGPCTIDMTNLPTNLLDYFNLLLLYDIGRYDAESLKLFIENILTVKKQNRINQSIWSDYIDQACQSDGSQLTTTENAIKKLIKCIEDRYKLFQGMEIPWITNLTLHDRNDNGDNVIFCIAISGKFSIFDALLSRSSLLERKEIRQKMFCRLKVLRNLWNNGGLQYLLQFYLKNIKGFQSNTIVEGFSNLILDFVEVFDQQQLSEFIQLILSVDGSRSTCIWSDYISQVLIDYNISPTFGDASLSKKTTLNEAIEILFNCVTSQLGEKSVRDLMFHKDANGVVIERIAAYQDAFKIMTRHLTDQEIRKLEEKTVHFKNSN